MIGAPHVLIVDDDEDMRGLLIVLLQSEGHSVIGTADGEAALEALASGPSIGLIVLDLEMPVMDGKTFLVRKARGAHARVPVVIFSSSPCLGLEALPDVVAVVSKSEGIESLLKAFRSRNATGCVPDGAFHV